MSAEPTTYIPKRIVHLAHSKKRGDLGRLLCGSLAEPVACSSYYPADYGAEDKPPRRYLAILKITLYAIVRSLSASSTLLEPTLIIATN